MTPRSYGGQAAFVADGPPSFGLPGFGVLDGDSQLGAALDEARAVLRLLESMG